MPRRGRGQQATQTATGQQYGQAQAQEEAQAVVPLPQMEQPRMRPGAAPFARRSERPNESVMSAATPEQAKPMRSDEQRAKVAAYLPMLEEMASSPYASPHLRNTARRLRSFVGNPADFADRGVPSSFEES
tara:strand:+ start:274 stop:666 length:393 start_codon:yes stop_codon:yes gene_type:complete